MRVSLAALSVVVTGLVAKLAIVFAPFLLNFALIGAAIAAVALLIEDLWVGFKGGDSVLLNLRKKVRAFFEPIERWVLDIPRRFVESIKLMAQGISDLVPDFVKKGIAATIRHVMPQELSAYGPHVPNNRWAPSPASVAHHNRLSSNQNVNVAVNVKSGADPHEIGGAVSKAVRKELERERFNAFMGVTQYAG